MSPAKSPGVASRPVGEVGVDGGRALLFTSLERATPGVEERLRSTTQFENTGDSRISKLKCEHLGERARPAARN